LTRAVADLRHSAGRAAAALRDRETARWLALLQVSDLLLDVLTGFVGVYLVDVAHASPAQAAIGVAVRLGAGLCGDAVFAGIAGRVSGRMALRVSAIAAAILYPAFLIVPGLGAKLAVLAALSVATACWYPVAQAGLYDSLPGGSGIAVFLSSAAGLAGAVGPLGVGFAAQRFGLATALAGLGVTPVVIAALTWRPGAPHARDLRRSVSLPDDV
jgi:FSR family fosmidomycin resistance protein-like MFS transporter